MLVGITGGVATGKSTVATLFRKLGATVFSADEAAHEVVAPGSPALQAIADRFGPEFILPDGTLDRARLGALVFADPAARADLERITHPAILQLLRKQIDSGRATLPAGSVIAVEVPLLFEAGMEDWFDLVIVVACSPDVQMARLRSRSGLDEGEATKVISAQMPLEEKVRRAHITLWNDGLPDELEREVVRVWTILTGAAV
jgi:dephospho-CoA kinase